MRAEIQIDFPYYLFEFLKPIIESTGMSIKLLVQVKRVHSTKMGSPVRFFAHHGPLWISLREEVVEKNLRTPRKSLEKRTTNMTPTFVVLSEY